VQHAEKAKAQIGPFGFADPQVSSKKPKEPIFSPSLQQSIRETNEKYIEKSDKQKFWAILAT
jgi:hypothetical protein